MTDKKAGADDAGRAEAQSNMDEINAKGYRGTAVDPTDNENYTVAGVTKGKPTPETDSKAEAEAAVASGTRLGPLAAQEAAEEAEAKAAKKG